MLTPSTKNHFLLIIFHMFLILKVQPRAVDRLLGGWVCLNVVINSLLIDEFDGIDVNELQMGKPFLFRVFRFVKTSVILTVYIAYDVVIKLLAGQHVAFFPLKEECFDQRRDAGSVIRVFYIVRPASVPRAIAEP